jgi:hypothetical protein
MVEVEKYFGFGTADCEACGGFGDLIFKSNVLEEVITELKAHKKSEAYVDTYWITDMKTLKPVDIDI